LQRKIDPDEEEMPAAGPVFFPGRWPDRQMPAGEIDLGMNPPDVC